MDVSKEKWVNYQTNQGNGRTPCNDSIVLMIFGVGPLFLRSFHFVSLIDRKHNIEILYDFLNDLVNNLKLKVNYQDCNVIIERAMQCLIYPLMPKVCFLKLFNEIYMIKSLSFQKYYVKILNDLVNYLWSYNPSDKSLFIPKKCIFVVNIVLYIDFF